MNTKKDKKFDYQAFMKEGTLDQSKIHQGHESRKKRRESVKTKITIRIDAEILEQFKQIANEGKGYQSLINLALREWLAAQGVQELVNTKISVLIDQAITLLGTQKQISKGA